MCWSFEVSLFTWIVGFVVGMYLLSRKKKNDIVMASLILTYSTMQLWEALMWLDQKCGKLNRIATILAYIALWSHVLAIGIGLKIEYNVILPLIIGVIMLVLASIMRPSVWNCSKPKEGGRHLVWGFNPEFYMLVFAVAIGLCLTYIRPMKTAVVISSLFLVSFILSMIYAHKQEAVGSFWCWVCAAFSFLFILQ